MIKTTYYDLNGNEIEPKSDIDLSKVMYVTGADRKIYVADADPKMSCRETILDEAKRCICSDRQNQYGPPEDSFRLIADLWNHYISDKLRKDLSASDVAIMMVLLKIARTKGHKGHNDNYVDMAGYAALAAELAEEELVLVHE